MMRVMLSHQRFVWSVNLTEELSPLSQILKVLFVFLIKLIMAWRCVTYKCIMYT